MNTPRPTITDEMILEAAMKVVPQVIGRNAAPEDIANAAESIVRVYNYPMDGYELAKELDSREYWDIKRDDVDQLDAMDTIVDRALREAEKAWFAATPVEPPFPVGTRITCGVIAGIYEYQPAYYRVKEDGCQNPTRFLLVKFENAKATGLDGIQAVEKAKEGS